MALLHLFFDVGMYTTSQKFEITLSCTSMRKSVQSFGWNSSNKNISYRVSQASFLFSFLFTYVIQFYPYDHCNSSSTVNPVNVNTMKASSFLPSNRFVLSCGCPGRAPWAAGAHEWVSWQFPPSPGQRAAGIRPHSAPQPQAASDHSTPLGHSSSCVCVSWVTREIQKVRHWLWWWIIQL